jgi:chemotaxis protein methyltransferase CheR
MEHQESLLFFAKFIETELGIIYAEHNYFQLQNRLDEIAKILGLCNTSELHAKAQITMNEELRELILDVATNNETSFFRDLKIFTALESSILPKLSSRESYKNRLAIWSAASSSGQEALSVAISISEWAKRNNLVLDFRITGTDISERILKKARAAHYTSLEVQRGLAPLFLEKYFKKDQHELWIANAAISKNIEYKKMNLIGDFGFTEKFDLILCRNVLIYQNVERKTRILKKIHAAMAPGGILILGAGESLIGLSNDFTQEIVDGAVFYCKKSE